MTTLSLVPAPVSHSADCRLAFDGEAQPAADCPACRAVVKVWADWARDEAAPVAADETTKVAS